jgi:hypothetical protein
MYAVMRLNTSIEVTDIFEIKHIVNLNNGGRMGYIPVYKTKKEAMKHTEKGKYQILKLQAT